jgi:bifunctional non-homologous end joining protein LigD
MAPRSAAAAMVGDVRLTHPEKVLYPEQGVTKRDLAAYYEAVGARMLEHVAGRLVSLVRCPEGASSECFFQRHGHQGFPPQFRRLKLPEKHGDRKDYIYVDDVDGLLAAAQVGALEIHIWGSRVDDIDKPDRMVFDLDPDPSVGFDEVKRAAKRMRDALEALELQSYPLLTGGKGIHVVVPLMRRHGWAEMKEFAGTLAQRFAQDAPDRFVATMTKSKRKGKIFIDFFRNDLFATAIAPYSTRARAGAPVAWPVTWAELDGFASGSEITIETGPKRLARPDPWKGYAAVRQSIKAVAFRALGL